MITIYYNPDTAAWHWQSSLLEASHPHAELTHALTDISLALRRGELDPKKEADLSIEADAKAAEVQAFLEKTSREVDAILLHDALPYTCGRCQSAFDIYPRPENIAAHVCTSCNTVGTVQPRPGSGLACNHMAGVIQGVSHA